MKKLFVLLFACVLCGTLLFAGCSGSGQEEADESVGTEATETEVTQEDIEKNFTGSWIITERDGQPALTNDKAVFTLASLDKAYISATFNSHPEEGNPWIHQYESDVDISGNKVTLSWPQGEDTTIVDEVTVTGITDTEQEGNLVVKSVKNGEETTVTEGKIRLVKISDDYSKDIIGTWEGHCTSEGSEFDDGKDHRWEYKDDGTYVYYVQDGDDWVPGGDAMNEYFVAGNLLCTRWASDGEESREWWDISIDGDKMNWTALRKGEDGKTFTVTFEMTKVEE